MRITFLGPPGSGKGTQAERLSSEFEIPLITTGEILRNTAKEDSAIGRKVKSYLQNGRLVPDSIILGLILEKIRNLNDFLLDGFPRTPIQAERLEETAPIEVAVLFKASETTIIARLSKRRICSQCGKVYNLTTDPPIVDGVCDRCGARLIIREDDREETVKKRIEVYREETLPLIEYYQKKGVLKYLDAEGDPNSVYEKLKRILFGHDHLKI